MPVGSQGLHRGKTWALTGFDGIVAHFPSKSSRRLVAALARVRSSGTRVLANAATIRHDPIKALAR